MPAHGPPSTTTPIPSFPNDIPFYRERIPSPRARILELGCGTGRVLVSMLGACGYIHGIDHSEEMLARCLAKLRARNGPPDQARAELGDITSLFKLGQNRFPLDSVF